MFYRRHCFPRQKSLVLSVPVSQSVGLSHPLFSPCCIPSPPLSLFHCLSLLSVSRSGLQFAVTAANEWTEPGGCCSVFISGCRRRCSRCAWLSLQLTNNALVHSRKSPRRFGNRRRRLSASEEKGEPRGRGGADVPFFPPPLLSGSSLLLLSPVGYYYRTLTASVRAEDAAIATAATCWFSSLILPGWWLNEWMN